MASIYLAASADRSGGSARQSVLAGEAQAGGEAGMTGRLLIMAALGAFMAFAAALLIGFGEPGPLLLVALFGGPFATVSCGAAAMSRLIADARWPKKH
jgi:hypothetical protein